MTLSQIEKRLSGLEKQMHSLHQRLDYQQAVEGIRRGLESADPGEGESVSKTLGRIRRSDCSTLR